MEAKDTVMNDVAMGNLLNLETVFKYPCSDGSQTTTIDCHKLAKAQAEISFKAGRESVFTEINIAVDTFLREAKQLAVKEIAKWIEKHVDWRIDAPYKSIEEWVAKVKEWGIEQ